jgi:hypothetical protein
MALTKRLLAALILTCIAQSALSQSWHQFPLAAADSMSSSGGIAAVSRNPSTMEVFWIGPKGTVEDRYFYDGAGWRGFTLAAAGSASTTGGIAVISRSPNTMEVFWIAPDGSVQDAYFYDGAPWKRFTLAGPGAASTSGGISAVSRSSNTMEVFWIGPRGTVEDRFFYDGAGWRGFTLAGPESASATGGIAAISRAYNTMEVFWTGPTGSVQDANFYDGAPWAQFTLAAPGSASTTGRMAAISRDPRCMAVWWIGPDGHVQDANWNDGSFGCEAHYSGHTWHQWSMAPPASASVTGGIAAASRSSNNIDLFWITHDGHVRHASWYPHQDWNNSQLAVGAALSGRVAAVSRAVTTTEIWWPGADESVQDDYWYSPQWAGSYAHLTSQASNYRWLVLKCTLSDNRSVPEHVDGLIDNFLTQQGSGTGNVIDYYSDVSYGAAALTGTVKGWYAAPFDGTEPQYAGGGNRYKRVQACADAIPAAEAASIGFGSYWGIIMVTNHLQDGGACWDGQQWLQIQGVSYLLACVVFDPLSMFTAFAAHEVGHGLGFPHSFDNANHSCGGAPGEYCDPWDIMSALDTYNFDSVVYPTAGPGVNVPNLFHQGWIPSNRIATYPIGAPATAFTLSALSHPSGTTPLAVTIQDFPFLFTVEYRQKDGWDAGIPSNAVILHIYTAGANPYSFLFDSPTFNGSILAGQSVTFGNFQIQVHSTAGGTANITIGPA